MEDFNMGLDMTLYRMPRYKKATRNGGIYGKNKR